MIYTEQQGHGPDIVLIHGWGMHGGIWSEIAEHLAKTHRVTVVDLPGHGKSTMLPGGFDLQRLARAILDEVPQPAIWLGWSLGGMVATQAALLQPPAIRRLLLVASLPQFSQSDDWPEAMPRGTLASFANNLAKDYAITLKRFLALQVRGADNERDLLRLIQKQVASRPHADPEALRLGLEILRSANLRPQLSQLQCPVNIILGDRDMLVPVAAGHALHALLPQAICKIIPAAGHAPFLSHQNVFLSELDVLLDQ